MPATSTFSLSGDPYVNGVLGDLKWATTTLTFSFPTSGSSYGSSYGAGEHVNNFAPLNSAQQAAVRASLDAYSSVSNLSFSMVDETSTRQGDLRFARSDEPSTAWAYLPSTAAEGGDAWFNASRGYYDNPVKGNYAYATFMHEIGHGLGLEHAHENNVMPVDRDSMEYTVMSYRSYVGASTSGGYTNEKWGYAQSLMMYDIAALQHMYGANYGTNSGNTTYVWSQYTGEMFVNDVGQGAPGGNRVFQTVWDGGGTDTYNFGNYTSALSVDLRPGAWTTTSPAQLANLHYNGAETAEGNIANALLHRGDMRSLIENAIGGSADDVIVGNDGNNILIGGAGHDHLDSLGGSDTVSYVTDPSGVFVDMAPQVARDGWGFTDTLRSFDHVSGSAHADTLFGDAGGNILLGREGRDFLRGNGGVDRIDGGDGWDEVSYAHDAAGVVIDMRDGYARDGWGNRETVIGIEHVEGSAFADHIEGTGGHNVIAGRGGDDRLWGRGGDDIFIFARGDGGDYLGDFSAGLGVGDRLDLNGFGLTSFADVLSLAADTSEGVMLSFGTGDSLLLANVSKSSLADDDFFLS